MRRALAIFWALALACGGTAAAATCRLHPGDKVVLYSASGDPPSVFAWDSPLRLRDYNAATYDVAQAMSVRATLLEPGTRALVASCRPNFVQSPYSEEPDDAVGITVITGNYHGKNLWVLGSDIRGVYHAMSKPRH